MGLIPGGIGSLLPLKPTLSAAWAPAFPVALGLDASLADALADSPASLSSSSFQPVSEVSLFKEGEGHASSSTSSL